MAKVITSVILITLCALPLAMHYYLKRRYRKLIEDLKTEDDYYHQCIFTTMKNFKCKQHLINKYECGDHCSYSQLKTLINFISTAKYSICLCVYTLTLKQINWELVNAHKRGVKVRIITDQVMLKTDAAKLIFSIITQNGISFKVHPSTHNMMHHKFCLIDKDNKNNAKMFFGSMNLTAQALLRNFDSVILTNNWDMIKRFSEEFEELWESF